MRHRVNRGLPRTHLSKLDGWHFEGSSHGANHVLEYFYRLMLSGARSEDGTPPMRGRTIMFKNDHILVSRPLSWPSFPIFKSGIIVIISTFRVYSF